MLANEAKIKIIEWNIHGAAALPWNNSDEKKESYEIKEWIVDRIIAESADIVVLTEFVLSKGWDYFQDRLSKEKYVWFVNTYTSGNGILIAIKNDSRFDFTNITEYKDGYVNTSEALTGIDKPDFYEIKVKYNNSPLSIIGVRIRKDIKTKSSHFLNKQFESLDSYLSSIKNDVICIGDFNVYWGNTWKTEKNHTLPKTSKEFSLHTPEYPKYDWYSFVHEDGKGAQLDHLITNIKNTEIKCEYKWDFITTEENGYKKLEKKEYKNIRGLPDHAILSCELTIKH